MKKILLLLTTFISFIAQGQPEPAMLSIKGFGGDDIDNIGSVSKTPDGGFMLNMGISSSVGSINTSCMQNVWGERLYRKYNNTGKNIEWEKCFTRSADSDYVCSFSQADGSLVLGGETKSGTFDWIVRKEDAGNNILWSKHYGGNGGEHFEGMIATSDGGFVMYGRTNSDDGDVGIHYGSVFSFDIWVLKLNSNGDKEWSNIFGGSQDEKSPRVIETTNGYYLICTTESSDTDCVDFHGIQDVLVVRIDKNGNKIWGQCYGGGKNDYGLSCVSANDEGIVIAAFTDSDDGNVSSHISGDDFWVAEIDSNKNIVWENCYGGPGSDRPNVISRATDGSLWLAGQTNGDTKILHIESTGVVISEKQFNIPAYDVATVAVPLEDGLMLIGGTYEGPGIDYLTHWEGGSDIYLAVFAPWTVAVNSLKKEGNNISVFPNPAKDVININHSTTGTENLRISDITGRVVYQNTLASNNLQIDARNWARGIYYVQIVENDNHKNTQKIILQ